MNVKLTEKEVKEIVELLREKKMTALKIAEKYNVAPNTISDIKLGRTWKRITVQEENDDTNDSSI